MASVAALAVFVLVELRASEPILPMRLFRSRVFSVCSVLSFIVGFAMIGSEAGEVLAVVEAAMLGNLPYTLLRDAILTHPTMAEGLNFLFSSVPA